MSCAARLSAGALVDRDFRTLLVTVDELVDVLVIEYEETIGGLADRFGLAGDEALPAEPISFRSEQVIRRGDVNGHDVVGQQDNADAIRLADPEHRRARLSIPQLPRERCRHLDHLRRGQ